MIRYIFICFISIYSAVFGWGGEAHYLINQKSVYGFPGDSQYLFSLQQVLADHASDADARKGQDPTEAPKHYIDIDNYSYFTTYGYIPEDIDTLINMYGYNFVYDQGILPWAVVAAFDSLKANFSRLNFEKAALIAADLGHYIGDASMPLHITTNYNGQMTGQTGIHSRYESKMISTYIDEISYNKNYAVYINDVSEYVFDFIYYNYPYVDSLLAADLTAKATSGGSYNSTYYSKLWSLTKYFTTNLLRKSSSALASLIYTAWIDAGKPLPTDVKSEEFIANSFELYQNYPNPFNPSTNITFSVNNPSDVSIEIFNGIGELVKHENFGFLGQGKYNYYFKADSDMPSGIYIYKLTSNNNFKSNKMILVK